VSVLALPFGHLLGWTGMLATAKITVGDHAVTTRFLGLTIDMDVVWSSLVASAIVLGLGFWMRSTVRDGVPGRLQLAYETLVLQIQELTDSAIGPAGREIVPLALSLFLLILTCNWLGFIPAGHNPDWLPPATADVNLPLAMALTVWVWSNAKAIRTRGLRGYGRHFLKPYAVMAPINVIEELTKPITLTFRLFGNVFSGALMVVVIATLLPAYVSWLGFLLWKPFELFIGAIQAFIFALLTIMYFGMAMSKEEH
jgi:F-type H+-transporting ATPase subunit a